MRSDAVAVNLVDRLRIVDRGSYPIPLRGRLGNQLWQISAGLCMQGTGLVVSPPQGAAEARIYRECLTGLAESSVRPPFRSYYQHRKWLAHPDDILRFLRRPASVPEYGAVLHYRLGDYKNYRWTRARFMSHDDVNGYLDLLGLRPRDVTVFTDSPGEVASFLPHGDWDIAPPMDTLTAFWAMMKCGRLICSASTFSYWAAYLRQGSPEDFVIHPVWTDDVKGNDPDMFKSFRDLVFWDGDFSCHPRLFV